jgi:anthranilate synthase component 2
MRARDVMHGKTSLVEHENDGILDGLPQPFEAMRYHSLVVDPAALPASLALSAWCKDGTVMAVRHRHHPVYGVQFHPESIGTACGRALVRAFLEVRPRSVVTSSSPHVVAPAPFGESP